tara:strand:+ start:643 stop:1887 length:1245 start_codon:yes stop_codon:yes gene_type:complete
METGSVFKPIIYSLIGLLGLSVIITPYISYDEAYFVEKDYYITMVDSIEAGYEPYISDLITAERNQLALLKKKEYYNSVKPISDSLQVELNKVSTGKDSLKLEKINKAIRLLEQKTFASNKKIETQFSLQKMPKKELAGKIKSIKDTLSLEDYVVIVANQIRNPNQLSNIPSINNEQIVTKKVNQQDKGGYLLFGLILIGLVIFMALMDRKIIPLHLPVFKYGIRVALGIITGFIGVRVYFTLANDIKFEETYELREKVVREKLMQIKNLQVEYLSVNQKYTNSWDSLINFAKNDSAQIVRYLVDKNDTAAVNNAIRNNLPIRDTTYIPIDIKIFGESHGINIDSISYIPFTKKQFSLKTNKAKNANNRDVFYIEVKAKTKEFVEMLKIYPENFDEEKFIQFGSLAEPTTEGNW